MLLKIIAFLKGYIKVKAIGRISRKIFEPLCRRKSGHLAGKDRKGRYKLLRRYKRI